jgi:hypothetical protein
MEAKKVKRSVGDYLCVRDFRNNWCMGVVKDVGNTQIKIHFVGFEDKWDEVVDSDGPHIQTEPLDDIILATLVKDYERDKNLAKMKVAVSLIMHAISSQSWCMNGKRIYNHRWTQELTGYQLAMINVELEKRCAKWPYLFNLFPDSDSGVEMFKQWQVKHFGKSSTYWDIGKDLYIIQCIMNPAYISSAPLNSSSPPSYHQPPPDYVPIDEKGHM